MHVKCHITSTWGKIKQHIIKFTPTNIIEELAKHFTQHRSTPNNRTILTDKEAHRHDLHSETFHRNNRSLFNNRSFFDPHHIRNAETINIGIDKTYFFSFSCKGYGQIHRYS
ncbi:hypothetical protein D3C78_1346380 [compost metagenome]